jgi:hypothetical protein
VPCDLEKKKNSITNRKALFIFLHREGVKRRTRTHATGVATSSYAPSSPRTSYKERENETAHTKKKEG